MEILQSFISVDNITYKLVSSIVKYDEQLVPYVEYKDDNGDILKLTNESVYEEAYKDNENAFKQLLSMGFFGLQSNLKLTADQEEFLQNTEFRPQLVPMVLDGSLYNHKKSYLSEGRDLGYTDALDTFGIENGLTLTLYKNEHSAPRSATHLTRRRTQAVLDYLTNTGYFYKQTEYPRKNGFGMDGKYERPATNEALASLGYPNLSAERIHNLVGNVSFMGVPPKHIVVKGYKEASLKAVSRFVNGASDKPHIYISRQGDVYILRSFSEKISLKNFFSNSDNQFSFLDNSLVIGVEAYNPVDFTSGRTIQEELKTIIEEIATFRIPSNISTSWTNLTSSKKIPRNLSDLESLGVTIDDIKGEGEKSKNWLTIKSRASYRIAIDDLTEIALKNEGTKLATDLMAMVKSLERFNEIVSESTPDRGFVFEYSDDFDVTCMWGRNSSIVDNDKLDYLKENKWLYSDINKKRHLTALLDSNNPFTKSIPNGYEYDSEFKNWYTEDESYFAEDYNLKKIYGNESKASLFSDEVGESTGFTTGRQANWWGNESENALGETRMNRYGKSKYQLKEEIQLCDFVISENIDKYKELFDSMYVEEYSGDINRISEILEKNPIAFDSVVVNDVKPFAITERFVSARVFYDTLRFIDNYQYSFFSNRSSRSIGVSQAIPSLDIRRGNNWKAEYLEDDVISPEWDRMVNNWVGSSITNMWFRYDSLNGVVGYENRLDKKLSVRLFKDSLLSDSSAIADQYPDDIFPDSGNNGGALLKLNTLRSWELEGGSIAKSYGYSLNRGNLKEFMNISGTLDDSKYILSDFKSSYDELIRDRLVPDLDSKFSLHKVIDKQNGVTKRSNWFLGEGWKVYNPQIKDIGRLIANVRRFQMNNFITSPIKKKVSEVFYLKKNVFRDFIEASTASNKSLPVNVDINIDIKSKVYFSKIINLMKSDTNGNLSNKAKEVINALFGIDMGIFRNKNPLEGIKRSSESESDLSKKLEDIFYAQSKTNDSMLVKTPKVVTSSPWVSAGVDTSSVVSVYNDVEKYYKASTTIHNPYSISDIDPSEMGIMSMAILAPVFGQFSQNLFEAMQKNPNAIANILQDQHLADIFSTDASVRDKVDIISKATQEYQNIFVMDENYKSFFVSSGYWQNIYKPAKALYKLKPLTSGLYKLKPQEGNRDGGSPNLSSYEIELRSLEKSNSWFRVFDPVTLGFNEDPYLLFKAYYTIQDNYVLLQPRMSRNDSATFSSDIAPIPLSPNGGFNRKTNNHYKFGGVYTHTGFMTKAYFSRFSDLNKWVKTPKTAYDYVYSYENNMFLNDSKLAETYFDNSFMRSGFVSYSIPFRPSLNNRMFLSTDDNISVGSDMLTSLKYTFSSPMFKAFYGDVVKFKYNHFTNDKLFTSVEDMCVSMTRPIYLSKMPEEYCISSTMRDAIYSFVMATDGIDPETGIPYSLDANALDFIITRALFLLHDHFVYFIEDLGRELRLMQQHFIDGLFGDQVISGVQVSTLEKNENGFATLCNLMDYEINRVLASGHFSTMARSDNLFGLSMADKVYSQTSESDDMAEASFIISYLLATYEVLLQMKNSVMAIDTEVELPQNILITGDKLDGYTYSDITKIPDILNKFVDPSSKDVFEFNGSNFESKTQRLKMIVNRPRMTDPTGKVNVDFAFNYVPDEFKFVGTSIGKSYGSSSKYPLGGFQSGNYVYNYDEWTYPMMWIAKLTEVESTDQNGVQSTDIVVDSNQSPINLYDKHNTNIHASSNTLGGRLVQLNYYLRSLFDSNNSKAENNMFYQKWILDTNGLAIEDPSKFSTSSYGSPMAYSNISRLVGFSESTAKSEKRYPLIATESYETPIPFNEKYWELNYTAWVNKGYLNDSIGKIINRLGYVDGEYTKDNLISKGYQIKPIKFVKLTNSFSDFKRIWLHADQVDKWKHRKDWLVGQLESFDDESEKIITNASLIHTWRGFRFFVKPTKALAETLENVINSVGCSMNNLRHYGNPFKYDYDRVVNVAKSNNSFVFFSTQLEENNVDFNPAWSAYGIFKERGWYQRSVLVEDYSLDQYKVLQFNKQPYTLLSDAEDVLSGTPRYEIYYGGFKKLLCNPKQIKRVPQDNVTQIKGDADCNTSTSTEGVSWKFDESTKLVNWENIIGQFDDLSRLNGFGIFLPSETKYKDALNQFGELAVTAEQAIMDSLNKGK